MLIFWGPVENAFRCCCACCGHVSYVMLLKVSSELYSGYRQALLVFPLFSFATEYARFMQNLIRSDVTVP